MTRRASPAVTQCRVSIRHRHPLAAIVIGLALLGRFRVARGLLDSSRMSEEHDAPTDVPSSHPTWVPSFDVEAFAVVSLRTASSGVPFLGCVPFLRRSLAELGNTITFRYVFLLSHVDGISTLGDIAKSTSLDLSEVVAAFLDLVTMGAVDLPTNARRAA